MAQHPTSTDPGTTAAHHTERLWVPWWLWLACLGIAALASAEIFLGAPGWLTWVPYGILLPLTAIGLWRIGRIRIAVRDGELHVDDAHLPVRFVAEVGVLDPAAKREAFGKRADPLGFVVHRPWVPGAVLVILDDPDDPTPYWIVSSRQPERLARAIRTARDEVRTAAAGSATGSAPADEP